MAKAILNRDNEKVQPNLSKLDGLSPNFRAKNWAWTKTCEPDHFRDKFRVLSKIQGSNLGPSINKTFKMSI